MDKHLTLENTFNPQRYSNYCSGQTKKKSVGSIMLLNQEMILSIDNFAFLVYQGIFWF